MLQANKNPKGKTAKDFRRQFLAGNARADYYQRQMFVIQRHMSAVIDRRYNFYNFRVSFCGDF
jgi:hypothetical protein